MTNKARIWPIGRCTGCQRERSLRTELCHTCYSRLRRTGSIEKQSRRSSCSVVGCTRVVISHGMCELHWDRTVKTGDPMKTLRPEDWGQRRKHPLYHRWRGSREQYGLAPEWNDFWQFVRDVGAVRPSGTAQLFPVDPTKILSPTNFKWVEPARTAAERNAVSVARRGGHKAIDLKRYYGLTVGQFEAMQAAQDNVCAICKQPERTIDKRLGRVRNLAVDHCHITGKVRGLLCQGCNQGLGNFEEDPARLQAALDYLKRHA